MFPRALKATDVADFVFIDSCFNLEAVQARLEPCKVNGSRDFGHPWTTLTQGFVFLIPQKVTMDTTISVSCRDRKQWHVSQTSSGFTFHKQ